MYLHLNMSRICQKIVSPKMDLAGTGYCVCFNLRKAARAVTVLYDSALVVSGLSAPQLTILIATAKTQPVSIGNLARRLLTDPTTLSRNLALLSRGRLVRVSPRSSMRCRLVSLTLKGHAALVRNMRQWRRIQAQFVGAFGEQRWQEMKRSLDELASIAGHLSPR